MLAWSCGLLPRDEISMLSNSARLCRRLVLALAFAGLARLAATTVEPPAFGALVNDSDCIVRAVTRAVTSEKRPGPNGPRIRTRVELEVLEVVAGTAPARLTLDFLGGEVNGERLIVSGSPRFRVGDEDILFVSGNGRSFCPLYAMMHGRYAVATDSDTGRRYVVRSDGMPLRDTAQISSPMEEHRPADAAARSAAVATALEPAEFIRRIRAAVKPGTRVSREK